MEKELRTKSRRRSRMVDGSSFISVSEMGTLRSRPSQLPLSSPPPVFESPEPTAVPQAPAITFAEDTVRTPTETDTIIRKASQRLSMSSPNARPFSLIMAASSVPSGADDESAADTDDEDEFFDAIETNTLPNLVITDSLAGRKVLPTPPGLDEPQYNGYVHPRKQLDITSDDRPPMSLWAVLKNSIGKDLTKISFPVFFNEPTSMLQRMVSGPSAWFCT